jgi:hypothetical protein
MAQNRFLNVGIVVIVIPIACNYTLHRTVVFIEKEVIKVMRINKDMRQRKRRLNKMYQWWLVLVTAPSGLELPGEADSPAKVHIL